MVGASFEVDRDSRNSIFSMLFFNVRITTNIVFRFSFHLKYFLTYFLKLVWYRILMIYRKK